MLLSRVYVKDRRDDLVVGAEEYARRELSEIQRIVIHHVGGGVNREYTAEEIADYHVSSSGGQGWPGIGYHFVAHRDGRLEYVGDLETVRYHVGKLNRESVGVCLAGDFTREAPPPVQLGRVRQLALALRRTLGREVPVVGHREVSELTGYGWTACPGDTWPQWGRKLLAISSQQLRAN